MQNDHLYTTDSSVYPGEYVPLFKENDFNETLRHSSKNRADGLPVNIKELENSYKIELAVPGAQRENLLLKAYGSNLSISVIYNDREPDKQKKIQLHEFNFGRCFTCKVVLPDNADTIFVSAECKAGILRLYIPKSTHPLKGTNTKTLKWTNRRIAIY